MEAEENETSFAPIDILDYIYAVLHSPTYRNKYKEFLKIDFPRVPYPQGKSSFKNLTSLGAQLRQIHLLQSPLLNKPITEYPVDGDNVVGKISFTPAAEVTALEELSPLASTLPAPEVSPFEKVTPLASPPGAVYINETQYLANVPQSAWQFYIGGYQPAQKWLKDRKGRALDFEDIIHYQKIIVALTETGRLMKEIDKIEL